MRFYFTSGKSTINNIIIVIYGKLIFVSKIHEWIFQIKIVETYFKLSFMFKRINVWAFSYLPVILQNKKLYKRVRSHKHAPFLFHFYFFFPTNHYLVNNNSFGNSRTLTPAAAAAAPRVSVIHRSWLTMINLL